TPGRWKTGICPAAPNAGAWASTSERHLAQASRGVWIAAVGEGEVVGEELARHDGNRRREPFGDAGLQRNRVLGHLADGGVVRDDEQPCAIFAQPREQ